MGEGAVDTCAGRRRRGAPGARRARGPTSRAVHAWQYGTRVAARRRRRVAADMRGCTHRARLRRVIHAPATDVSCRAYACRPPCTHARAAAGAPAHLERPPLVLVHEHAGRRAALAHAQNALRGARRKERAARVDGEARDGPQQPSVLHQRPALLREDAAVCAEGGSQRSATPGNGDAPHADPPSLRGSGEGCPCCGTEAPRHIGAHHVRRRRAGPAGQTRRSRGRPCRARRRPRRPPSAGARGSLSDVVAPRDAARNG